MLALGYSRSYSVEHNGGVWRQRGTMSSVVLHRQQLDFDAGVRAPFDAHLPVGDQLEQAVNGLRKTHPEMSATSPMPDWQRAVLVAAAALNVMLVVLALFGKGGVLPAIFTLPFTLVIVLRMAAVSHLSTPRASKPQISPHLCDHDLPHYSVFVPLHRESAVVPALVQALSQLDYPQGKLEILFITEASDSGTRRALMDAGLLPHMQTIIVPVGLPQTKPRALNFAMQAAKGDLIAVFDAEDVPSPRQLRDAAECFAASSPDLVCLQARLSIYNTGQGFLTRQFALEYAALFEALLPLLEHWGLPILLGGTSNHFRRTALEKIGGWDPFNVTEDADLGVRLTRFGLRTAMLDSDTWEEAPANLKDWMGQRTRWLKGWMQTYVVHMRDPRRLWLELGAWRFAGLQVTLGGTILSALVHPLFYLAAALQLSFGQPVFPAGSLWALCWFNLAAGYAAGIILGMIAAWRSHGKIPVVSAILVPVYWLIISYASYRALLDLYVRPYHWEKTPHAARPVTS
jgi:glycosyltransferase XagB